MKMRAATPRKGERGQTIALVAASLVALLGMAALSIDVVTLYVARGDAQRAADAAALAGAKMFSISSFSTRPGSFTPSEVCSSAGPGSSAAANKLAEAVAGENSVSNQAAAVTNIVCDLSRLGNPQVTVTVKRDNLPTFFSRIWSSANTSVSATAVAEAYNASGQVVTAKVKGVKPWLLPNCDLTGSLPGCSSANQFVDPSTGAIAQGGTFIGTQIPLTRINTLNPPTTPVPGSFYPLDLKSTSRSCPSATSPSCDNVGTNDYEDDIACSSNTQVSCGPVPTATMSVLIAGPGYGVRTRRGARCLIHAESEGSGNGQDDIAVGSPPIRIQGGSRNPISALFGENVSRSDSVITVPLYDGGTLCTGAGVCNNPITVVGFLQMAISQTVVFTATGPQVEGVILNAVGCNGTAAGVSAGSTSPVAVRLIHP